jgi:hypothetical protein
MVTCVGTGRCPMSSVQFLIVVEVALDVTGWRALQLLYHVHWRIYPLAIEYRATCPSNRKKGMKPGSV